MKGPLPSDDLILRRAAPENGAALVRLAHAAYDPYVSVINAVPRPAEANYNQLVAQDEVWIAGPAEKLVASLVLRLKPGHLLIWSIAVSPSHQKHGLGNRLLDFSIQRARDEDLGEVRLVTNALMTQNRAWYARNGFVEFHQEQLTDRTAIHMNLVLEKRRIGRKE